MKKKASFLLISTLLFLLAACHKEQEQVDDTLSLKIGYIPSTDALPYVMAQQLGIYDSLQLSLKLIPMESECNRDTLFQQKKTDGCMLSPIELFIQQKEHIDIFPALTNEGLYYVVASNDSTLVQPKQLKEKTLCVAKGSVYGFFADKVLEKLEIGEDEINKPELSTESMRLQMLTNAQIDAAVLRDPYASKAVEQGCKVFASSSSYPLTLSVTAFSDSILNTKEEDIKKLIIGYNLAVEYMNKHPQKEWLTKAASAAGLHDAVQELPPFKRTNKLSAARTKEMIQWMQENDLLPVSKQKNQQTTDHPVVSKIYKELK